LIINKTKFSQLLSALLLILLSTLSITSVAKSVEDLLKDKALSIKVSVVASKNIVAKQPVTLVIEVATNRWFAKGTKVHDIDLTETVILPNNKLTINGTERISGQTWVVQTHEIVMYPMQVGVYALEPILVDVSINTENDGIVSGTIQTKSLEFETSKPAELESIEHYIVTPELIVTIESTFDETKQYQVGEAITETVTIKVKDVPSMMILPLVKAEFKGLSIYQKPVKVSDKNIRGTNTGTREESTTYIFEQTGNYQLPQQTVFWWNPETAELKSEIIPARKWTVAGISLGEKQVLEKTSTGSFFQGYIVNILIVMVLMLTLWQGFKHKKWLVNFYKKATNQRGRDCENSFLAAIHQQQWQLACQQLYLFIYSDKRYQKTDIVPSQEREFICFKKYFSDDIEKTLLVNKLLKAAYQKSNEQLTIAEAKNLLKQKPQNKHKISLFKVTKKIQLNPNIHN